MGLKRQLNQPADKLCRLDPAGLPESKGERPGHGVDLIHEGLHPGGIDEDIDARDPARVDCLKGLSCQTPDLFSEHMGKPGGDDARGKVGAPRLRILRILLLITDDRTGADQLLALGNVQGMVPENANLDFEPILNGPLHQHSLAEAHRRPQGDQCPRRIARHRDADARARHRRLYHYRVLKLALQRLQGCSIILQDLPSRERYALNDGKTGAAEHQLGDNLIHSNRRGDHASTDVREIRQFTQALYTAILPVRPMDDRKGDIDRRMELPTQPRSPFLAGHERAHRRVGRQEKRLSFLGLLTAVKILELRRVSLFAQPQLFRIDLGLLSGCHMRAEVSKPPNLRVDGQQVPNRLADQPGALRGQEDGDGLKLVLQPQQDFVHLAGGHHRDFSLDGATSEDQAYSFDGAAHGSSR